MPIFQNITNQKFGRWLVLQRVENGSHKQPRWLCRCVCGTEKIILSKSLKDGSSKSCGCLNKEIRRRLTIERNKTHGYSKTPIYTKWANMRERCFNKNSKIYYKYGGRGISICFRWEKFENFLEDMGELPSPKHTLDRIDPKKDYSPDNCRWVTMKVQQNNRTNNRKLTCNGVTKNLQQWAETAGIARKTITSRIARGWSVEQALTTKANFGSNQYDNLNNVFDPESHHKKIKMNNRKLKFNGVTKTLQEWANDIGTNSKTISKRLSQGWSIKDALKVKPGENRT